MKAIIHSREILYASRPEFWRQAEGGKWEPETFNLLDKYIEPGKIFIDCGAWTGVFSLYASKLGAKVHAIEPDPVAYAEMKENILENDANILTHYLAIAGHNGMIELNSMTKNGFGNSESSIIDRGEIAEKIEVKCMTLEKFISRNWIDPEKICLIKMDVEGAETIIIKEATILFKAYKPVMLISFHPGWFEDFKNDVQMFIDVLFPIYEFTGAVSKNVYDRDDFINAMLENYEHGFLLKAK